MAAYEPIWEGWKEPVEDDSRPWRLVITTKLPVFSDAARAMAMRIDRETPGVYPGASPDDE